MDDFFIIPMAMLAIFSLSGIVVNVTEYYLEVKIEKEERQQRIRETEIGKVKALKQHNKDVKAFREAVNNPKGAEALAVPQHPVKKKKGTLTPLSVRDFEKGLAPQVHGWR